MRPARVGLLAGFPCGSPHFEVQPEENVMTAFKSLFPRAIHSNSLVAQREGFDPADLVRQAKAAGGWRARLKMQGMVNSHGVEMIGEAIAAHFAARREEMLFRAQLMVDSAKKRAVADQIADIAIIEREIQGMTNDAMRDVTAHGLDAETAAAQEEMRRIAELKAALERGEVSQSRFEAQKRRIEEATDRIVEAADAVSQRVLQNLAGRLDLALRAPNLAHG
jgi:hypothetical protein